MTVINKYASMGDRPVHVELRTDAEILSHLQDVKIKRALIENFGTVEGSKCFQIYKQEEPAPLKWRKKRKLLRIPSQLIGDKAHLKGSNEPLHLFNGKKMFQVVYQFIENSEGEIEFWEKLEPLTKKKLFQQAWLERYKQRWEKKDGDLLCHTWGLDLARPLDLKSKLEKPSPPTSTGKKKRLSCCQRLINWIKALAKRILAFFSQLLKKKKREEAPLPSVEQKKIVITLALPKEEE